MIRLYKDPALNASPLWLYKDRHTLYPVAHVTGYRYNLGQGWEIDQQQLPLGRETAQIFVIDTLFDDAFSHWVYESAIYLQLFLELKQDIAGLKLYVKSRRKYKFLFFEHFGISSADLIYDFPDGNRCFFPLPISSWNDTELTDAYQSYVDDLFQAFATGGPSPKTMAVLCSPRAKQEIMPETIVILMFQKLKPGYSPTNCFTRTR